MIRRDYLLRMIEQCVQALRRSLQLSEAQQFDQARDQLEGSVQQLAGAGLNEVIRLTESELTAALLQGEPTQVLRLKAMALVALLHRAGDIDTAQEKFSSARVCYLQALDVYLDILLREGEFECPEFVPKLDLLAGALQGEPVPPRTSAMLMQVYERSGQFGKAEDVFFSMLEALPAGQPMAEFGIQFFERLLRQTDEALELGNLPRSEVEAGLAELRSRLTG